MISGDDGEPIDDPGGQLLEIVDEDRVRITVATHSLSVCRTRTAIMSSSPPASSIG
jgi:hypothetical protein